MATSAPKTRYRMIRVIGSLLAALFFSGVVAVSSLALLSVLGVLGGYPGLYGALALSSSIFVVGTIYVARAFYRDADRNGELPDQ